MKELIFEVWFLELLIKIGLFLVEVLLGAGEAVNTLKDSKGINFNLQTKGHKGDGTKVPISKGTRVWAMGDVLSEKVETGLIQIVVVGRKLSR
jgi:hypothetical protein